MLKDLLQDPMIQEAIDRANAARAECRAARLAEWRAERAEAEKTLAEALGNAERLRPELQRRHAEYLQAMQRVGNAEWTASWASDRIERLGGRADFDLGELGSAAIDRAIHEIRHADMAARTSFAGVRLIRNWRGTVTDAELADPTFDGFIARMAELRAEIEALRFSDLTPAEIEKRCEAAVAEAQARDVVRPERKDRETVGWRHGA